MKKYIFLPLGMLLLIVIISFSYIYLIWSNGKQIEQQMIKRAYHEVPILKKVEDIDLFSGKDQYYFIFGKSEMGNPLLIWLNDDEVNYKYLFNWVTKERIKEKVVAMVEDISIKRITAGITPDKILIYEVLYEDDQGRLGYIYFNLENGEYLKMYRLGKN
ncbi:hypothetical protein BHF71_02435 [Vulcanibacillus modesticaldus]|uniref:DUF5590 domain-containing protein n=1 Tax=Vulcanibacillus modesticaldus TaxID=337097 RepID=A0A1D2YTM6_9BACI|nr:DUF5590 domain-containing protein [Vulcanibacillus modesticaldus]OEF99060.1 hypothetical protein BHF71_02435 [Vulcanibacillus modesticaldus]